MFGQLGEMMGLLGNLGKISKETQGMMDELKEKRITGIAGAEQVKVTLNGMSELVDISIAPELVAAGDVEMIEELIKAAFASAFEQSRAQAQENFSKLAETLPLGPLKGLLGQ